MYEQKIICPNCQGQVLFDVYMLLQGAKFSCPNCHAEISLANESRNQVKETIEKFDQMKQQAVRQPIK